MIKKIFPLIFLLFFFSSCQKKETLPIEKPTIVVSLSPYDYFLHRLAEESFTLITLVPGGTSPHTFDPTAKQLDLTKNAVAWFYLGEPFEKKLLQVVKDLSPKLQTFDLCEGIDLLVDEEEDHHHDDLLDRHVWLNPKLVIKQIEKLTEHLTSLFPERKALFEKNKTLLINELTDLDKEITKKLERVKGATFLVSHPAFAYLCKEYAINQLAVEQEGKEPSAKMLGLLLKIAKESNVKIALAETEYNNLGIEAISKKLEIPVYLVDPYAREYFANMRHITEILEKMR